MLELIDVYSLKTLLRRLDRYYKSYPSSALSEYRSLLNDLLEDNSLSGLLILENGSTEKIRGHRPYFYVIYVGDREELEARLSSSIGFMKAVSMLSISGGSVFADYEIIGEMKAVLKENGLWRKKTAWIAKVVCDSPSMVPLVAERLASRYGRCNEEWCLAAYNIRYPVRLGFDAGFRMYGFKPLYEGGDSYSLDNFKGVVLDIEDLGDNRILVGLLPYRYGGEIDAGEASHFILPGQEDELDKELDKYTTIIGFNILGYDLPRLWRIYYHPRLVIGLHLDLHRVVEQYGYAMGIGAGKSLYAVAKALKDQAGITREELELKRRIGGRVRGLSLEEVCKYNANDLVLTAKLANVIGGFVLSVSMVTGIPPSMVSTLPGGLVAEYYWFRYWERRGVILGYDESRPNNKGSKVLVEDSVIPCLLDFALSGGIEEGLKVCIDPEREPEKPKTYRNILHYDVKSMYPSFVLNNLLDPSSISSSDMPRSLYYKIPRIRDLDSLLEVVRSRNGGERILLEPLNHLYDFRLKIRSEKKKNPLLEPVDSALKSILNALAYGVVGKASGVAPCANSALAELIFHGTRAIEYEYFRKLAETTSDHGCRPIYADTDSLFVSCESLSEGARNGVERVLVEVLGRYGLVAELEDVYDRMVVARKKNYITFRDGAVKEVKGGSFVLLIKHYLPQTLELEEVFETCLGDRLDYECVEKLVREHLASGGPPYYHATWASLFISYGEKAKVKTRRGKSEYIRVNTGWTEPPTGLLKKLYPIGFHHPCMIPLLDLIVDLYDARRRMVEIESDFYEGMDIVESYGIPGWGSTSIVSRKICGDGCSLVWREGEYYCVCFRDSKWWLSIPSKPMLIPTRYDSRLASSLKTRPRLKGVVFYGVSVRRARVSGMEDIIARCIVDKLRELLG